MELEWKQSSFCESGACVQVAGDWVKSSRSGPNGNCVEVARSAVFEDSVWIRNSRDPNGPVLLFTRAEWDAFVAGVRAGEFDLA